MSLIYAIREIPLSDSTESLHFNEDSSFTPNYGHPKKRKDTPFLEATFYP